MRKVFLLIITFASVINVSVAQTTFTWIGGSTGDYQVATNWSPSRTTPASTDILSFNATASISVINVPNQTIGALQIASGTGTVSFVTNVSTNVLTLSAATPLIYTTAGYIQAADFLTIALANTTSFTMTSGTFGIATSSGGKVILNGAVTLAGGKFDFDVVGSGGTIINGSVTYLSGIFSCANANAITWANGSNYYHTADGASASSIPLTTWSTGSSCSINGMSAGTTVPSGITTNSFYNLNWNCASQFADINLLTAGDTITANGTFTVANTGSKILNIAGAAGGILKLGAYSQTSGTVVLQSSTGSTSLRTSTSFSHTGGTLDAVAGSGAGTATLDFKGSVTKNSPAVWQCSSTSTSAQMTLQFSGSSTQNVIIDTTTANWSAPIAGRTNIIISNSDQVSGVSLNGKLRVYNTNSTQTASCTLSGLLTLAATGSGISYTGSGSGGTGLIYSWSFPQTASSAEFPTSSGPKSLTINNNLGVSFPSGFNRTLTGTFTLLGGILDMPGDTLFLTNNSLSTQLVHTGGYIYRGALSRKFPTSGLPTDGTTVNSRFPFGTGTNDRSFNVFFSGGNLTGGTSGTIIVSHTPAVGATAISITDDIPLDKRSNSKWEITVNGFSLGSGGQTISVTALGTSIGSVNDISTLRLTNAVGVYGNVIATTGTTDAPLAGKSNLTIADITSKTLYFGSDNLNALQIITFVWKGTVSTDWTNAGNWTGGVGYPSSSTEIADLSSTLNYMPTIPTATSISLYQLIVGAPVTLTLAGTSLLNVADTVTYNGSASFASTSTFTYSGTVGTTQNIASLTYGNLVFTGSGNKVLPATVTVTGNFSNTGAAPVITGNTFIFAGSSAQKISSGSYNNLTINGNRGGAQIGLGNLISANTIDVSGIFSMTATNYTVKYDFNTFVFSSTSTQTVPGFIYGTMAFSGADKIFDPLGSSDPTHVIQVTSITTAGTTFTTTGSKVRWYRTTTSNLQGDKDVNYNDLEISGNMGGTVLKFFGRINVMGKFTFACTNFTQTQNYIGSTRGILNFNGTGDQTIPACVTGFSYDNITYTRGSRKITLESSGTIRIYGDLSPTGAAAWSAGGGFITTGSTVNFIEGPFDMPLLQPASGTNNYNNVIITGGTRKLAGSTTVGGNLTLTGTDASQGTLKVGDGAGVRTLTILGNLVVSGTSSVPQSTGQIDLNTGTTGTSTINLAGNLSVSGVGQITSVGGAKNGTVLFNGTAQQYSNTSSYKNGFVNYIVGDGTAATTLTLNNTLDLYRSSTALLAGTLTVTNNSTLNCGTNNITVGDGTSGTAAFNLNAGSILITSNTGGVEGIATSGSTGTILNDAALMTKTYNATASYVLNGATTTPFPAAITNMLNLTTGANVSLNKAVIASGTLDLASFTLTQAGNNLQFSGLTSSTGNIYADKNSSLTISGTLGTVGALRFASGGNITGQFTINRPVTIALNSDLTIDKTPLSGDLITGTASSILNINGNTLTINGAVSGPGTLSGSATSNLTLGGTAGTVNFTSGSQVLKNLSLVNNATATLGTALDITAGASAGNAGAVSVTGTAILTTGGNLTLKSNVYGTARVGQGSTSGGYISGAVSVERYIESSAKRAWRLLSAPAYGQTIKQAWQENQAAGVNPGTGYGTIITSNSASWAANGFDYQTPGNSLLIYNSTTNVWDGVTNTNVPITGAGANNAYMVFIRGDRSATPYNGPASTSALIRIKGSLFQGDLPAVPVTVPNKFVAVGNNYASAIDFTTLGDANVDQVFTVWDPKLVGSSGLGGYVTFSATTSPAWKPVPAGGSYVVNVPNTRIESGQGFVVYSTPGNGNINFKESSKLSGSNMVFRPMGSTTTGIKQSLTTNFYSLTNGNPVIADGNTVVFNTGYSNTIDNKDAFKLSNLGDNLGIKRDDKVLIVEARQPVTDADTVFFEMKKIKLQSYRIELIAENFDGSVVGFLEDKFLKTSTIVNMSGTTSYDFAITTDPASYVFDRFRVVFKSTNVLPVTFSNIKAAQQGKNIAVEWKVENEINIRNYDVEKSADGRLFTKANETSAKGGNAVYNWTDVQPAPGDNFYRIKSYENSGKTQYSKTVKVNISKTKGSSFTIYPNPVSDGMIGLQMKNADAGLYNIKLINQLGQVVEKSSINHNGGTATQSFQLPKNPGDGVYQLEIVAPDNKTTVLKILVLGN